MLIFFKKVPVYYLVTVSNDNYILHFLSHTSQDMLPEYIHMRIAESILFAGKAIRVLRNPSPSATLQDPVIRTVGSHGMQSSVGGSGVPKELANFSNIRVEELLPQAEADKIDSMLKELKVSCQVHNFCWFCFMLPPSFVACTFPCCITNIFYVNFINWLY